jgi:aminopeptidase N
MVKHLKNLLILLGLLPAVLSGQQHHSCPLDHHLGKVYQNPLYDQYLSKYDVKFYHLSLEVSNKSTFLDGFATILGEVLKDMDTIVFQLNGALEVSDVQVNGTPVEGFLHADEVVYVPFDAGEGEMFSVQIFYSGTAGKERGFFAGITSAYDNTNEQWVTYTLSEPLNARDWFPVKQVLADKADSVWVDLICDRELMAGSIGLLEEIEELPENKHKFKWRSNYPIAYYLISLAVADYRDYSFHAALSDRNDSVLVQNYIYDDDDYFMTWKSRIDRTGDMITLFSDLVMDYPFAKEKYGHAVAPMGGGMEHQTMSTMANFNFNLVAHELAHQWFGNSVTCGTWQDIWINEGFASYFEYIALENLNSREAANNWMEYAMTLAFGKSGSVYVPESEAEDVYRVFDYGLSYKKGAVLLHMIRYELNDDALFFNVLNTYSEITGTV